MPAPIGNNNAKKGNEWRDAIQYAVKAYEADGIERGSALKAIAKKVIGMALEGDIQAVKEIGDRLDGKPVQAVTGGDGGPLTVQILRFADTDPK
jgi:hypothetical protein